MNSNLKHYLGYGLTLVALLLLGRFYYEEKVGRVKAEAQVQIIVERDKAQAETSARYEKQIAELKTPAQAAPLVAQALQAGGEGKKPFSAPLSVPRASLAPDIQKALPDAPEGKGDDPVTLLDPDQQVDLGKRELGCQKVEGELSTCELDKQNLRNEINDLKGGTKWGKVVKEAKCLGFLGGGAALGSRFGGWKGAAVGGVAGEVGCKIFF